MPHYITFLLLTILTPAPKHPNAITTGSPFKNNDSTIPNGKTLDQMQASAVGQPGFIELSYTKKR